MINHHASWQSLLTTLRRQLPAAALWLSAMIALLSLVLSGCTSVPPKLPPLPPPGLKATGIYGAGPGSGFLPYAEGLARHLTAKGLPAGALVSRGSVENMQMVDFETNRLALVFLGTAYEGVTGTGDWTGGRKFENVRALTPMYETSFQIATLRASGISNLRGLQGKKVGVGPAGGPAENFFKGLLEANGLQAQLVNGTPQQLGDDLMAGRIDALWQGASVPIPALKRVADVADTVVFGLTVDEVAAMRRRFPFLAPASVAAGTYRGQNVALQSVAAWNFVIVHKDMAEADAYWFTRTILSSADPLRDIHSSATGTRATNAMANSVVPFHPGALRYYGELGIPVK